MNTRKGLAELPQSSASHSSVAVGSVEHPTPTSSAAKWEISHLHEHTDLWHVCSGGSMSTIIDGEWRVVVKSGEGTWDSRRRRSVVASPCNLRSQAI